jgi:hypothetical protein
LPLLYTLNTQSSIFQNILRLTLTTPKGRDFTAHMIKRGMRQRRARVENLKCGLLTSMIAYSIITRKTNRRSTRLYFLAKTLTLMLIGEQSPVARLCFCVSTLTLMSQWMVGRGGGSVNALMQKNCSGTGNY